MSTAIRMGGVTMALTRQAWMNIEMDELAKQTIDPKAD